MRYIGCCVELNGRDITKMVDVAREITYQTLLRHVGRAALIDVFPDYAWNHRLGLKLHDDWSVTYHKSVYRGKPCYYVRHSAIEYIFIKEHVRV